MLPRDLDQHLILLAVSVLLPVLTLASAAKLGCSDSTFNLLTFPLQQAICPGVNRAEDNKTVDLQLLTMAFSYPLIRISLGEYVYCVNPNAKRTLLLLHRPPSLWASWRYQIPRASAVYRWITLSSSPIFAGLVDRRNHGLSILWHILRHA